MTASGLRDGEAVRQPAEWDHHVACWTAWPSHVDGVWEDKLADAQVEFAALCREITAKPRAGQREPELLNVLVPDERNKALAAKALAGIPEGLLKLHVIPFGDIWLRDTAPIFVKTEAGKVVAACFEFNGWGGKYEMPHDTEVAAAVAKASGLPFVTHRLVLEGGSVDVDGEGTCLTSRQCLLSPSRNPELTEGEIEARVKRALGVSKVLWLGDGLLNDHTDGHIDTIARFVAPGVVACMEPAAGDPNAKVMQQIIADLESFTDAKGRKLKVVKVPSPGKITDDTGRLMPASYLNFYIGNANVVVPTYGAKADRAAVEAVAALFPGRRTVGSSALAILSGGGAFHCITQQQPS